MPSFDDHCEHSRHNLEFLDSFFLDKFNDWAITVMFYAGVHMVEAILDKDYSIHSQNHYERFTHLTKLTSFTKNDYKVLEREAHNSRYKKYRIYSWEVHRIFKDHFQRLVNWFNNNAGKSQTLDIQSCINKNIEWLKRYQKDNSYNKCC